MEEGAAPFSNRGAEEGNMTSATNNGQPHNGHAGNGQAGKPPRRATRRGAGGPTDTV